MMWYSRIGFAALAFSLVLAVAPNRAEDKPQPQAEDKPKPKPDQPDPTAAIQRALDKENADTINRLIDLGRTNLVPESLVAAALLLHRLDFDKLPVAEGDTPPTPQSLLKEASVMAGTDNKLKDLIAAAREQVAEKARGSVPFSYECDRTSGFVVDPNSHKRIGYITDLKGLGMSAALAKDLRVMPGFSKTAYGPLGLGKGTASVVGVLEKITWAGGVGDPLILTFFVSQQNATVIKTLQQGTLKTMTISSLGFMVAAYDPEQKVWFDQFCPNNSARLTGLIAGKSTPQLNVDLSPVAIQGVANVNVYRVSMAISPGANAQYALYAANSANKGVTKAWGLVVGTLKP